MFFEAWYAHSPVTMNDWSTTLSTPSTPCEKVQLAYGTSRSLFVAIVIMKPGRVAHCITTVKLSSLSGVHMSSVRELTVVVDAELINVKLNFSPMK
jgi:hypothetical protein